MKDIFKLLSSEELHELMKSLGKMHAMGIKIRLVKIGDGKAAISVQQEFLTNGLVLNRDELKSRAESVFENVKGIRLRYAISTYRPNLKVVTKKWIKSKMDELGLKQADVCNNLHLDKATLSGLLSEKSARTITRFQKSAFYYYFLTFEINKNMRKYIQGLESELDYLDKKLAQKKKKAKPIQ